MFPAGAAFTLVVISAIQKGVAIIEVETEQYFMKSRRETNCPPMLSLCYCFIVIISCADSESATGNRV